MSQHPTSMSLASFPSHGLADDRTVRWRLQSLDGGCPSLRVPNQSRAAIQRNAAASPSPMTRIPATDAVVGPCVPQQACTSSPRWYRSLRPNHLSAAYPFKVDLFAHNSSRAPRGTRADLREASSSRSTDGPLSSVSAPLTSEPDNARPLSQVASSHLAEPILEELPSRPLDLLRPGAGPLSSGFPFPPLTPRRSDVSESNETTGINTEFSSSSLGIGSGSSSPRSSKQEPGLGWIFSALESKFSPRMRGLILLNILTFLYGTNVTVVKEAESLLDPFSFSLGRFAIAALAFSPFLQRALESAPVRRAGIELGIWASLAYVTQAVGLLTTDAGRAAFIGTFTVIEVPIIAGLFGASIPTVTWWAAAAAVAGVGLLEAGGGNSSLMGDFWTIVSALIFGFHMLRSEHHARHVPEDGALPLIALQLFVTAVMSLGWLAGMSHLGLVPDSTWAAVTSGDWTTISNWPWLQMAYTGVLSTAFCLWVEVVSLRDVTASEAAMVYTLEPLYGAGFAWVLLGERWGPLGWVGAALILGGSLTMQLFGKVESVEDEPEEIEAHKSPAAILGALGLAAAIALFMAATGGVPQPVSHYGSGERLVEASQTEVSWSGYDESEIDSLATFMRAYAMMKGDGLEDDLSLDRDVPEGSSGSSVR